MGWDSYTPAEPLPRWWPATVKRIIKRDPVCKCAGCLRCSLPLSGVCKRPSQTADHVVPRSKGGSNKDLNLQGMCYPCHGRKTAGEGNAAKAELKQPSGFFEEKPPGSLW